MLAYLTSPKVLRAALPAVSFGIILFIIYLYSPRALSYMGLNLMLQYAVPIALATIAQMYMKTMNTSRPKAWPPSMPIPISRPAASRPPAAPLARLCWRSTRSSRATAR